MAHSIPITKKYSREIVFAFNSRASNFVFYQKCYQMKIILQIGLKKKKTKKISL